MSNIDIHISLGSSLTKITYGIHRMTQQKALQEKQDSMPKTLTVNK